MGTDDIAEAIKDFQNVRQIHAQRAEGRHQFSHAVMLAGTGVIAGILTAAEKGSPETLSLHWIIPFFVLGIWAFDIRYRVFSGRAEELMQRMYTKQLNFIIGSERDLHPSLARFRDNHIQYYSLNDTFRRSTQFIQLVAQLPLTLIFIWSLVSVVLLERVPRITVSKIKGIDLDYWVWLTLVLGLTLLTLGVRVWRRRRFRIACRELDIVNLDLREE